MSRLFENPGLKVVSLLISLVLWFLVAGEKTSEIGLTVPVELQNMPTDLEVVGEAANTVEVRLRATPAIVRQLDHEDVSVRIDLKGVEKGEHFFHLTETLVRRPFGVTVVKLSPASLTLNLEQTLEREVPIAGRIVGTPDPAFEVSEILAEPSAVRLAGPRSRIVALKSVFTEAVSVDARKDTVSKDVNIGIGDPLVRIQGSSRVKVTVRIRERHQTRTFARLQLEVRGGPARVRPSFVEVSVEGPRSVVSRVAPEALQPYADVSGAVPGAPVPVAVQVAPGLPGLAIQRVEPREVRVMPGSPLP
jgi:YbbR domain-containing protein